MALVSVDDIINEHRIELLIDYVITVLSLMYSDCWTIWHDLVRSRECMGWLLTTNVWS